MDYDEFGNYVGPELSDEDSDELNDRNSENEVSFRFLLVRHGMKSSRREMLLCLAAVSCTSLQCSERDRSLFESFLANFFLFLFQDV